MSGEGRKNPENKKEEKATVPSYLRAREASRGDSGRIDRSAQTVKETTAEGLKTEHHGLREGNGEGERSENPKSIMSRKKKIRQANGQNPEERKKKG